MSHLRILVVLLVCLAVPFTAMAGIVGPAPCPMQAPGTQTHGDAKAMTSAHECCDTGHGSSTDTHKSSPCKPGFDCKTCPAVALACMPGHFHTFSPALQAPVAWSMVFSPSHGPHGLWRPPC